MITRWLFILVGLVIFIIGVITFPTPSPTGLPFMVIGLVMLLGASKTLQHRFRYLQRRYPQSMRPFRRLLRMRRHLRVGARRSARRAGL